MRWLLAALLSVGCASMPRPSTHHIADMFTKQVNTAVEVMDQSHGVIQFMCDQPSDSAELGRACGHAADAYRSAELAVHIAQRAIDAFRETGEAAEGMQRAVSRAAKTAALVVEAVKGLRNAAANNQAGGNSGDGPGCPVVPKAP